MYTITTWNKTSTNFDVNAFVKEHGTGSIQFKSEDAALQWMARMIDDKEIIKAKLVGPKGSLIWTNTCIDNGPDDEPCDCYGCVHGGVCRYDDSMCDDCGDNGDCDICKRRVFRDDPDEFDLNDPRQ